MRRESSLKSCKVKKETDAAMVRLAAAVAVFAALAAAVAAEESSASPPTVNN